jgi:hypothetical protein
LLWPIPKTNLVTAPILRETRLRLAAMIIATILIGGFLLAGIIAGFQGVGAYHRVMEEYKPGLSISEPPTRQALVVGGVYFVGATLCTAAAFLFLFLQVRLTASHRLLVERGRLAEGTVTNVQGGFGYVYVSGNFGRVTSGGYLVEFEYDGKTFKTEPVKITPATKVRVAFDPENPTYCVVMEAAAVTVAS